MKRDKYSELARRLQPHLGRQSSTVTISGGGGGAHVYGFSDLDGELAESQAPWVDTHIADAIAQFKPHSILDAIYHSVTGAQYSIIGLTATDTLGLLTSTADGAINHNTILRSGASGDLALDELAVPVIRSLDDLTLSPIGLDVILDDNVRLINNTDLVIQSGQDLRLNAAQDIELDSVSNFIKILASNSLQSDHFVSQLTGWRMTYDGELDTRYMYSDQLKVKLFIADLEQALAGSSILTKSSTTLSRPFIVPFPGEYNLLYVDDLPSAAGMAVAESGDMVRLQKYSRTGGSLEYTDVWGVITEYADQSDKEQRWKFTRVAGGASVSTPTMVGTIQTYASPSDTSAVLTKPTGTSEGHTLYAFFVLNSATVGVTAPDVDWTLLASDSITELSVFLFSKVAGGSEGSNYTFSFDESVTVNSSVQTWSGIDESQQISVTKEETATTTFTTGSLNVLGLQETQFLFSGFGASLSATEPDYWVEALDTGMGSIRQYCAWTNGFDIGERGFAEGTISGSTTSITVSLNATPTYSGLDLETGYAEPYSVIDADTFAIDYGVSGNGFIEMTTVDGAYGSNSPYMRVVTWTEHPATGATVRTMNGQGLEFLLPTAAETLTRINWKESLPSGDSVAAIDVYSVGDATTMLLDITAQMDDTGQILLRTNNDVGTSTAEITLQAFDTANDARITLNANTINLGSILETDYINILTNNGTLDIEAIVKVDGKLKVDTASETFTTSNWGKALELDEGMAIQWLKSSSSYSRGIGYTSDGNLYFFTSTANDNSAAPVYDIILYPSGWMQITGINPTDGIGTDWTALSLNTGWVNFGGSYQTAEYKKVGDLVFLRGLIARTSGTATLIGTLPSGYRPILNPLFIVATNTGYGEIEINSPGQISWRTGGVGYLSLDGLIFSTTQ